MFRFYAPNDYAAKSKYETDAYNYQSLDQFPLLWRPGVLLSLPPPRNASGFLPAVHRYTFKLLSREIHYGIEQITLTNPDFQPWYFVKQPHPSYVPQRQFTINNSRVSGNHYRFFIWIPWQNNMCVLSSKPVHIHSLKFS